MSFKSVIDHYSSFNFKEYWSRVTPDSIAAILKKDTIAEKDFLSLLAPAALPFLEQIAQIANQLTLRHFGKVIFLFTPLYISNFCENRCSYCSFALQHTIGRRHLSLDEIRHEAETISRQGIRHILVLTGEARRKASPGYLADAVRILRDYFSSIAIEVYPMTEAEYGMLIGCGVDTLTLYQETYNEAQYHVLHKGGPKDDYEFRLDAPERACRQHVRSVTVGALLGLHDPAIDVFFAGLHAAYLQKSYPSTDVAIAFPRMRPLVADFKQFDEVTDRAYVQYLTVARLFLPTVGSTLSTRESKKFRNAALNLGVTRMSAGVSTAVGGHTSHDQTPQFEIADTRSVDEMKTDLLALGFQGVLHDWNGKYVEERKSPISS